MLARLARRAGATPAAYNLPRLCGEPILRAALLAAQFAITGRCGPFGPGVERRPGLFSPSVE